MNILSTKTIREIILPFLAVLAFVGISPAETPPAQSVQDGATGSQSNGSVVVVPAKFQLGDIEPGSEHSRTFRIRNVSKEPIRVVAATPTCRCTTTTDIAGSVIPPDEDIEFIAVLAAPVTPGKKNAKVQITFVGNLQPLLLEIGGDITMAIKADPPYVGGARGDENQGVVSVASVDGKPFTVLSSGGRPPSFLGFNPEVDAPRSEYTLRWNLGQIEDLPRHVWWALFTDHPDCPVLPLRIRNPATGARADMERYIRHWRFDESLINAERLEPGRKVVLEFVLKHYNPRARGVVQQPRWGEIQSVVALSDDLEAAYISSEPLSDQDIKVLFSVTPKTDTAGPIYDLIQVTTSTGRGTFGLLSLVATSSDG